MATDNLTTPHARQARRFSTDSELKAAKRAAGVYELSDTVARGLRLRVQPSGARVFWYVYKDRAGKSRRVRIGEYGHGRMALTDARTKRHELAAMRADPTHPDPHEFVETRALEEAAEAREKAIQAEKDRWTMKAVGEAYLAAIEDKRRLRTVSEIRRHLNTYVYPKLGEIPANDVTDDAIRAEVLHPLEAKGRYRQRNAVRVSLNTLFNWARDKEKNTVAPFLHGLSNPVRDIAVISKKDLPKGYGMAKAALPQAALKALWSRLNADRGNDFADILALQLLTGARISEAGEAQWRYIDLDAAEWRTPGKFTKSGEPHLVHLSQQAVELLSSRSGPQKGRVFHVQTHTCIRKLSEHLTVAGFDATEYGTHSLRKSVATGVIQLGYRQEVRRHILNHRPGGADVLEQTYVKAEWARPAAEALDRWGAYLDGLVADQVVAIRA